MENLTIFIMIYIISVLGCLFAFYSDDRWAAKGISLKTLIKEVIPVSFIPFFNTFAAIVCLIIFICQNIDFNKMIIKPWKK